MKAGEKRAKALGEFPQTQVAGWIKFAINVVLAPVVVYMLLTLIALERDVAVIQANRWTSQDQAQVSARMWEAINQRALRSEVPPEWFIDRMDRLELMIQDHIDSGH